MPTVRVPVQRGGGHSRAARVCGFIARLVRRGAIWVTVTIVAPRGELLRPREELQWRTCQLLLIWTLLTAAPGTVITYRAVVQPLYEWGWLGVIGIGADAALWSRPWAPSFFIVPRIFDPPAPHLALRTLGRGWTRNYG